MAGSVFDFTPFNFTDEQVRSVRDLRFDQTLKAPAFQLIHTIEEGIVTGKEVGFVGKGSPVGRASQGCDSTPSKFNIASRKITWKPKEWEVYFGQCYDELQKTMGVYSLKYGVDAPDLIDTDYELIVLDKLGDVMADFCYRLPWFGETDAKHISDGGNFGPDVDLGLVSLIDGFWKQIQLQTTANPKQLVPIAENAGLTYKTQKLDPKNMQGYLSDLFFNANMTLRSMESGIILCTQSFHDAYVMSLQNQNLESTYTNLIDGVRTITVNGIPLLPLPIWDEMIQLYCNDGTRLINPHRALYTTKDILGIGVDSLESTGKDMIWFEKKDAQVYVKLMGKIDAELMDPSLFNVAI